MDQPGTHWTALTVDTVCTHEPEASSRSSIPPYVADGRQDVVAVFVRSERGLAVIGGIDVRVTRESSRGAYPFGILS